MGNNELINGSQIGGRFNAANVMLVADADF